jgi:hypothetical protein
MHEDDDAEFLDFCPERIEPARRQLFALDAAADRGASQSKFTDGLVELLGSEVGMLQRDRRQRDEPRRIGRTPCRELTFCTWQIWRASSLASSGWPLSVFHWAYSACSV